MNKKSQNTGFRRVSQKQLFDNFKPNFMAEKLWTAVTFGRILAKPTRQEVLRANNLRNRVIYKYSHVDLYDATDRQLFIKFGRDCVRRESTDRFPPQEFRIGEGPLDRQGVLAV